MEKFIQYRTKESLYNGAFDGKVGWAAAGMGDVIVTENGKLIVVDGGCGNDAEDFVALLEEQAGNRKPEIEYWIITHPHGDHYGCIQAIAKNPALSARIDIKQFWYWFPEEFLGRDGQSTSPQVIGGNRDMEAVCRVFGAASHRPARDEQIELDGMTLRFLYVPDDCSILNTAHDNANFTSLIFTVQGKNKKVMVTGDAYNRSMQVTAWRYYRDLKCDILQMPHHALCDSFCPDFFRYADPEVLLMPISIAGYRAMHSEMYAYGTGGTTNLVVEARAKEVYKAFEGTVTLTL